MERDRVVAELKKSPQGYTISELASQLRTTRNTIAIILAYLEGAGNITIRQAGMAKIHYWKESKKKGKQP